MSEQLRAASKVPSDVSTVTGAAQSEFGIPRRENFHLCGRPRVLAESHRLPRVAITRKQQLSAAQAGLGRSANVIGADRQMTRPPTRGTDDRVADCPAR